MSVTAPQLPRYPYSDKRRVDTIKVLEMLALLSTRTRECADDAIDWDDHYPSKNWALLRSITPNNTTHKLWEILHQDLDKPLRMDAIVGTIHGARWDTIYESAADATLKDLRRIETLSSAPDLVNLRHYWEVIRFPRQTTHSNFLRHYWALSPALKRQVSDADLVDTFRATLSAETARCQQRLSNLHGAAVDCGPDTLFDIDELYLLVSKLPGPLGGIPMAVARYATDTTPEVSLDVFLAQEYLRRRQLWSPSAPDAVDGAALGLYRDKEVFDRYGSDFEILFTDPGAGLGSKWDDLHDEAHIDARALMAEARAAAAEARAAAAEASLAEAEASLAAAEARAAEAEARAAAAMAWPP